MSSLATTASTSLGDADLGDWAGIDIEADESASRKVTLSYDSATYTSATMAEAAHLGTGGYYAALAQASPGIAAWWVYSSDDIAVTSLSNESDYATRIAEERDAAAKIMFLIWAGTLGQMYRDPIPAITMRPAVSLAAAPGSAVQPVVGVLQDYDISNEIIDYNNSARVTTKYRPSDNAVVIFLSSIISATTRKPLAMTQTSPGVFELPEPGYGCIIANYTTRRRKVSLAYEAFTGGDEAFWTDEVREQFARDTFVSGTYPEEKAPPVMLLVTSARTHAQMVAKTSRGVNSFGAGVATGQMQTQSSSGNKRDVTLTEQSRTTVSKRITSSQNSSQYVDVDIATEIQMDDGDGNHWLLRFSE